MRNVPKRWADYSLDYKLFFVLAFCLFLLFGLGGVLGLTSGFSAAWVAAAVAVPLILISVAHRINRRWRWQGVGAKDVLGALFALAVIAVFLYAATPMFPPVGAMLPWYLFGGAIGAWNVLAALKVTHYASADFDRDCEPRSVPLVEERDEAQPRRSWRDVAATGFSIVFFSVWLAFLARFYLTGVHLRDGARAPDAVHVYPVKDDPAVAYITAQDGRIYEILGWYAFAGIPTILLLGAILHFILKVPVLGSFDSGRKK